MLPSKNAALRKIASVMSEVLPDLSLRFVSPPPETPVAPRSWRGFRAEHMTVGQQEYSFERSGETHFLALHDMVLDGGALHVEGLGDRWVRDIRRSIAFVPKGVRTSGWMAPAPRPNSFTALYFEPSLVGDELERRYAARNPGPVLFARDPALLGTLDKIEHLLKAPEPVDDLHAESLCLLAALEVFGVRAEQGGTRLTESQVMLVTDYVEAKLSGPIGLDDLASLCGMTRFHFARAFKNAVGVAPYAFVQSRRIDRAAALLTDREIGVEQVGAMVGFPSASQFRRAFRQKFGCSAQEFRRRGAPGGRVT